MKYLMTGLLALSTLNSFAAIVKINCGVTNKSEGKNCTFYLSSEKLLALAEQNITLKELNLKDSNCELAPYDLQLNYSQTSEYGGLLNVTIMKEKKSILGGVKNVVVNKLPLMVSQMGQASMSYSSSRNGQGISCQLESSPELR